MVSFFYMLSRLPKQLALCLVTSSLFGLGCAPKTEVKPVEQKMPPKSSQNPSVLLFPAEAKPNPTVNEELQTILSNFRQANSLRTKFDMTTAQGQVQGNFQFIRPNRFKGVMQAQGSSLEIVVVDDSLFLKAGDKPWANLSGQPSSKTLTDTLRKALSGNSTFDAASANSHALVTKSHDEARACDAYKTTAKTADGSVVSIEICAANMLPKFVSMTTDQGPVRISYTDYNTLFLIEKPLN